MPIFSSSIHGDASSAVILASWFYAGKESAMPAQMGNGRILQNFLVLDDLIDDAVLLGI